MAKHTCACRSWVLLGRRNRNIPSLHPASQRWGQDEQMQTNVYSRLQMKTNALKCYQLYRIRVRVRIRIRSRLKNARRRLGWYPSPSLLRTLKFQSWSSLVEVEVPGNSQ